MPSQPPISLLAEMDAASEGLSWFTNPYVASGATQGREQLDYALVTEVAGAELLGEGGHDREQPSDQASDNRPSSSVTNLLPGPVHQIQSADVSLIDPDASPGAQNKQPIITSVLMAGAELFEQQPSMCVLAEVRQGEEGSESPPAVLAAEADADKRSILQREDAACTAVADVREEGGDESLCVSADMAGVHKGTILDGDGTLCSEAESALSEAACGGLLTISEMADTDRALSGSG